MPTDPSTDPATATTRRTFLARTAIGGAAATAVLALPLRAVLAPAGAQAGEDADLGDAAFGDLATPIELAAVELYQQAIDLETDGDKLFDAEWLEHLGTFQKHHVAVAETTATLRTATEPAVPDGALMATIGSTIGGATDEVAVLLALAGLEDALSATHLKAVASLADPITAKLVCQVLTIEAQTAAYLGHQAGSTLEDLTPAEADTTDALTGSSGTPSTTTSTTEAGDDTGSSTTEAGGDTGSSSTTTSTTEAD